MRHPTKAGEEEEEEEGTELIPSSAVRGTTAKASTVAAAVAAAPTKNGTSSLPASETVLLKSAVKSRSGTARGRRRELTEPYSLAAPAGMRPRLARARPPRVATRGPESSLPQVVFFSAQEPKAAAASSPDQMRQESAPETKEAMKLEVEGGATIGRAWIEVGDFRLGSKATENIDNRGRELKDLTP